MAAARKLYRDMLRSLQAIPPEMAADVRAAVRENFKEYEILHPNMNLTKVLSHHPLWGGWVGGETQR